MRSKVPSICCSHSTFFIPSVVAIVGSKFTAYIQSSLSLAQYPTMRLSMIYHQLFTRFPVPSQSCEGKTVIVTGSNTGLGFEAAKHFARLNCAKLILAVRSIAKGEAAAANIKAEVFSEYTTTSIEVWPLDLSNYNSVKEFAERAKKLDRLDVLLENAAVATFAYNQVDGEELTIATNVIGTFLLAFALLPKLRETAKSLTSSESVRTLSYN